MAWFNEYRRSLMNGIKIIATLIVNDERATKRAEKVRKIADRIRPLMFTRHVDRCNDERCCYGVAEPHIIVRA
jgi:hypothetical protein